MDRPPRLTLVALTLAAVAVITAIGIGGILSTRSTANDAKQAKDIALALAYEHRATTLAQCQHDNSAALARIASAEAIVQIAAGSNPLRPTFTPAQQWLAIDFVKRENAAINKNNPLQQCTLPALGLPLLPPLTRGAREILEQGSPSTTTKTAGGTANTVTSIPPAVSHRPTTTLLCCTTSSSRPHCVKKHNRGTCRGKP